jgi:hypothetical protein
MFGVMGWPDALVLGLVVGGAAGALVSTLWLRARGLAKTKPGPDLEAKLDEAAAAQTRLADMQAELSVLRHDLHGILSPALLTADRLTGHDDPAIRRAGDIVVRTVERATARLAATKEK